MFAVRIWLTRRTRDSLSDELGRGKPVPTVARKLETREAEVGLENPGGSPLGVLDRISRMVLRAGSVLTRLEMTRIWSLVWETRISAEL